ncbi:H+/Cl- antiporter ClcA [Paraburkholderia youngii]
MYNVPLGGAIFVLEVLLGSFSWRLAVPALVTSSLAAVTAWVGLGNEQQYSVAQLTLGAPLVVWSAIVGPVFGVAAWGFVRLTSGARAYAPKDWRLPALSVLNFAVIGVFVVYYPQLVGNGKGPAGLAFDSHLTIGLAATLLLLKVAIEASRLRAGAEGGLLTPGLTNGALLAVVLGGLWNMLWPGTSAGSFAIVGASAFLAASMQMPLTAIVLMLEFTRVNHDALVPMLLCIAGSVSTFRLLSNAQAGRAWVRHRRASGCRRRPRSTRRLRFTAIERCDGSCRTIRLVGGPPVSASQSCPAGLSDALSIPQYVSRSGAM